MKPRFIPHTIWITSIAITFATGQQWQAGDGSKPVMRDAATHEDLEQKLRRTQASNPLANYTPRHEADPTKKQQPVDILERSDVISFNGLTTIIPKRAILALPDAVKNRVGQHVPGHRIVAWKDFLIANRGWITTIEVSREQAEGRQALSEQVAERVTKSSRLVVATYQRGPISVMPPQEPTDENSEDKAVDQASLNPSQP